MDGDEPDHETGNGAFSAHAVLGKLQWAFRCDPGCAREHNEDFAGVHASTAPDDAWDRGPLFVVADGLGGHAAGEVASRLAVETMLRHWTRGDPAPPQNALRAAVRAAHTAVFDAALEHGKRGMGTTVVAATLAGKEAILAHVGDSRAYHVRGEVCTQLTSDHTRVAEMVRMKLITPEQAATHPSRSMLTRSLGGEPSVQIDISRTDLLAGDTIVLCSDGLWGVVSRAELTAEIMRLGTPAAPTPTDSVEALVDLAIKHDAPDNVTCLVIRITSDRPIPAAGAKRGLFRRARS